MDHSTNNDDTTISEEGKEGGNIFQYVTTMEEVDGSSSSSPSVLAVLAYACIRLAHLSHDAFGDSRASKRLYKLAASCDPNWYSYHGIGTSVEASITQSYSSDEAEGIIWREQMEKAVDAYREAARSCNGEGEVQFHLAVALERLEEAEESEQIMETLRRGESNLSCLVDSWGYVRWHTRRTNPYHLNLHRGTRAMLEIALEAAQPLLQYEDGLVCEFGVASGRSCRMTQELLPLNTRIDGFDTFTGMSAFVLFIM